jgi:hypothetical protein
MITGTVELINSVRGMVAVQCESGDYTVFELLGDYSLDIRDKVAGNLDTNGGEELVNRTTGERMDVFIQAIHASRVVALNLLR